MVFGTIIPQAGKLGLVIVGVGMLIYNDKILAMVWRSSGGGGSSRKKSSSSSLQQRMGGYHERLHVVQLRERERKKDEESIQQMYCRISSILTL